MTDPAVETARRAELAANLADVEQRVVAACTAAGRPREDVEVIAITKTFPASDVRLLAGLGMTDVGENRDQEAVAKHADCAGLGLRWHFVGRLQRNKCRSVARYADLVHSVDRAELATALGSAAVAAGRPLGVLVQVSLDPAVPGADGRGGVSAGELPDLADLIGETSGLTLAGVMAVAPLGGDADAAFGRLEGLAADLRDRHPGARVVSAGMSADLEAAVRHGATHLRVGSALLGTRSSLVG